MQPSIRCSAFAIRCSELVSDSSTQSRRSPNPVSSRAACATRSRLSAPPSTASWLARILFSFTARTIAKISAMSARPAAASAAIPRVVVRSSTIAPQTTPRGSRQSLRKDGRERALVVVGLLLARDGCDLDLDRDRLTRGRGRGERHRHGLGLPRGDRRQLLLELDRFARAADRDLHGHVLLVVLALV